MRQYLTPLSLALMLGCSGAAHYGTQTPKEECLDQEDCPEQGKVSIDPTSYTSLTKEQRGDCEELLKRAQNDPSVFHSASAACQDYVIQSALEGIRKYGWEQNNLMRDGFQWYLLKMEMSETMNLSHCWANAPLYLIKSLNRFSDPDHTKGEISFYANKEEEKKCKELEARVGLSHCNERKGEYVRLLHDFEGSLQKVYGYVEARAPLATQHADYLKVKKVLANFIEEKCVETQKYICGSVIMSPPRFETTPAVPNTPASPPRKSRFKTEGTTAPGETHTPVIIKRVEPAPPPADVSPPTVPPMPAPAKKQRFRIVQ